MVLLIDNGGQTCNQLWAYAYALLYSIETDERICVLTYDKELVYFPNLLNSNHFVFPLYSEFMHKCLGTDLYIKIIRRLCRGKYHNLYPLLMSLFRGKILKPWDNLYSMKHTACYDYLKSVFEPSKTIVEDVNTQFLLNTNNYDLIVGVHIRRGDYRFWQSGHYFFEMNEYREICNRIKYLYPKNRIKFFISTNEHIDNYDWKDVDYFTITQSTAMKDLYCLSKCDYIVGPPSSFSRWAAYIGRKKMCFILDKDQKTFDFKEVKSYGYFIDDSPIWYNIYSEKNPNIGIPNHPLFNLINNENI